MQRKLVDPGAFLGRRWPDGGYLVVAMALGALVASDAGLQIKLLAAALLVFPLQYLVTKSFEDRSGGLLLWGGVWMLVATGAQEFLHVPLGYMLELTMFGVAPAIALRLWREMRHDRLLRMALCLWGAYFALSLLSSLLGRSQTLPAIWQLQYNLKWLLMFGLGALIVWGKSPERLWRLILVHTWWILAAIVALEIAWPGGHARLFGPPPDLHSNPLLGIGLRYRGPFVHSGNLAIVSGLFAVASMVMVLTGSGRQWLWYICAYLGLMLLSGQRQESFAGLLTMGLFMLMYSRRYWFVFALATMLCLPVALILLSQLDHLPMQAILAQWGGVDSASALSERAILSVNGTYIAQSYFPLGSGLGTYGGAGAQKFDQSLFVELGFGRYWWFRQGLFLVDTFWPSIIAESGFLAAALLLLTFMLLWIGLLWRCLQAIRSGGRVAPVLTALGALSLLLLNSPSSAVLTDPRGAFLLWLLIGCGWRMAAEEGYSLSDLSKTSNV